MLTFKAPAFKAELEHLLAGCVSLQCFLATPEPEFLRKRLHVLRAA